MIRHAPRHARLRDTQRELVCLSFWMCALLVSGEQILTDGMEANSLREL